MPNPDNISTLYGELKDVYDLGSEADFRKYLSNANNREALRKELENDYEVGDSASFSKYLGFGQGYLGRLGARAKEDMERLSSVKPKPAKETKPQATKPTQPTAQPQRTQPVAPVSSQPAAQPWQPEEFSSTDFSQKLGAGANRWETMGPDETQPSVKPTDEQMRTAGQRMRDELDYTEATGKRLKRDDRVVRKEWEAPAVVRDDYGNMVTGPDGQPMVGSTTDEARVAQYNEQERHLEEIANAPTTEDKLNNLYEERERIDDNLREKLGILADMFYGHGTDGLIKRIATADIPFNPYGLFRRVLESDPEVKRLLAASHTTDESIRALEAEVNDSGFLGGMRDTALKHDFLPLNTNSMDDAIVGLSISQKIQAARQLGVEPDFSPSERIWLDSYMNNQDAMSYDANRGWGYNFGQTTATSLEFMAEFLATGGGMGIANKAVRGATKMGLRAAESEVGRAITKNLGVIPMKVVQSTLKGTGRLAGAVAGGAFQSNTIGFQRTWSDIIERQAGDIAVDKWGDLTVENREGLAKSIIIGQLENIGENGSELLGPAFDFMPKILGRVMKRKIGEGAVTRFMSNEWMRKGNKFLSHAGVQGVFGEGMEEEANALLDDIKGRIFDPDNPNNSNFFDTEERIDRWLTTAALGVVLRAPQVAASTYQSAKRYGYQFNLNGSDRYASELFGSDRWGVYRDQMEQSENKNLGRTVSSILKEPSLSNEEKEAVLTYAGDLAKLRGFNLGALSAEAEGIMPERPRTNSYNIRGNVIEEVDERGNVIETHEYEDREQMKAGLFGLQQERANHDMLADIESMKTRPDGAYETFMNDFAQSWGLTPEELQAAIDKEPIQRNEPESQIIADFSLQLHQTVYGNNMLHTEQSFVDGKDAAEAAVIDIENPDLTNAGKITGEWASAKQSREELFSRNEEIKQEVESMEQQGLSPQEIISRLDTFRSEDVQTLINYYNARAQFSGLMAHTEEKINEHVANERERRTFKGTINGEENQGQLIEITDGTNTYTLVSGNVTANADGVITDSDSGLLVALDSDGNFVSLSDADGLTVIPTEMSLDDWATAYQEELGANITEAIDPEGTLMEEQPQAIVEGNEEQAGAEAGAEGTGADEAPAEPLSSEPQQPAVSIESVKDKDGIKRYENGVEIDDAIADIITDGFDVDEIADASISEAQQAIEKIDKKPAKTRKDIIDKKKAQDVIDYYKNVKARWEEVNAEAEPQPTEPVKSEENVNVQPEVPIVPEKPVSSQPKGNVEEQKQQRIAEAKAKYGELFDDDFTKANDVYELVSMWVGRKRNLAWDDVNGKRGLQKELGWTRKIGGDTKFIETLLAKKGEGMGVDEFAHMVWESPENDVMGEKRFTDQEIKEALLELLKSAQSKSDVVDYGLNTRIAQAEATLEEQQRQAAEAGQIDVEPLTDEEMARINNGLPFDDPTDEEIPEDPKRALWSVINEVTADGNMPAVMMIDTDQMTDGDWIDLASQVYGGAFVDEEEVAEVRDYAMQTGAVYDGETDTVMVFSGAVTPETLREKLEEIKEEYNGTDRQGETDSSDEPLRDSDLEPVEAETPQEQGREGQAEEGSDGAEGQGSTEPGIDEYLQPRNDEEKAIVANVLAQLQQEISDAVEEKNKARSELQKAQAKESERATDMFGNDNALNQPGQLFDNSDMPIDQSVEGVERRTETERERLQAATNRLNQLQSEQERNSRIRGALDNYRRQTTFDAEAESQPTSNPIEAIDQAAQSFREAQEEVKSYGADNKLVSQDRYEELKKRMKQKMFGQLNAGFDPEVLMIGTEMAMYHIEAGARKFADYATRMILDIGDVIRPYLKSFYEGARRMPGMEELSKEMDSTEAVDAFDVLNYDKQVDNSVNVNKTENNNQNNDVSLQQEASEEVERKAEDADKYRAFSQAVADDMLAAMEAGERPYKSIKDIRAKAKSVGLEVDDDGRTDILLQELVEDGLVSAARQYVNLYMVNEMLAGRKAQEIRNSRALFDDIVKLYNLQPSITQRSSNRIKMGQFSTPLPMSFVADVFATPNKNDGTVLEPTAGNGMMVFAVPEYMVHANELDKTRLDNLRAQKFKKVTDQDATKPFEGDEQYDAIIANPPFGAAPAKDYDGKMISGLDEQIALNALSKMKDDGKAAIIIGGNMEYAPNGAIKSDKAFFTYLYDHYNVKGVIDMDGKLFSKQGTTYPTRMILIDGRRSEEERAQSKVYPPTIAKAVGMRARTFEELFDIAERIKNDNNKTNGNEVLRTSTGIALPDTGDTSGNTNRSGHNEEPRKNDSDGQGDGRRGSDASIRQPQRQRMEQSSRTSRRSVEQPRTPGLFDSQESSTESGTEARTDNRSDEGRGRTDDNGGRSPQPNVGEAGRTQSGGSRNVGNSSPGVGVAKQPQKPKVEEKRELGTDKLSYRPHNTAFSLESVAPAAMVEAMDDTLKKIEKEHGNIDAWVTKELGYDSIDDMHNALAAEQVDSVAMAIYQMLHGQALIIGDQTGVGKGRQMAALIRWACRQGKKPIFVTYTSDLFSDIYRDLVDIGSGELKPFIFNSDGAMEDANGNKVYTPLSAPTQKRVFETGKFPDGYDFAVLTYSQVSTGDAISKEEAKETAKKEGKRYQSKKAKKPRSDAKATFLRAIAKDNYMFLDESHNAAGASNTGAYFRSILKDAKAATFASATFAKRPDTMPLYAIRTAMSKAKVKADELIKIIENGGVTLQEIMSRALTEAGQMVRRERDMSDVKTDWKTVDDPETVKKARENYDSTIAAFNAIIRFQDEFIKPYLERLSSDLADVAASAGLRQGTDKMGIENPPFVSKTYNYTKQLMLALKVDAIVDEVVKEIEAGRHPVIALDNTMGSFLDDYNPGDTLDETTFAASLLRGLKSILRYTIKDEDGNEQQKVLSPSQLGEEGEAAYKELENFIRESTSGIFISPLDAIIEKLQQKGYSVGELTGRSKYVELDENTGEYVVRRRTDKDKKKLAREFNNGSKDVLILNKSASTGISLHASEKFSDQRQRTMIIAQPLADINDYMQMIGRIDRTGQVHRGYYINLGLPVPAEGRFLMMLSTKLKSLNANTTTSQENESNDVEAPDLLNKYGSQVIVEYLRDNPDIYVKIGEPLKQDGSKVNAAKLDSYTPSEDDARKITGYIALLPTDEQEAFYDDVVRRYTELIKYLNDTGSNDLKISVLPLRARTIEKQISSEGADPTGDNPFAGHAYVEWVEMDVLKKPMKAAEVGKVIEQLNPEVEAPKVQAKTASQEKMLNQRMTPRVKQIYDTVEKEYQAKMDKEEARYAEAKAKAEEAIKEQTEKINNSKRTPEQKKEAIEKYKGDKIQALEETHNNMVNKIVASRERIEIPLRNFEVGDSYLVPDDLTTDTFFGASPAIFCGFKAKDGGITPSTTLAVFCTLDGRRKIEIKLSDWGPLARIKDHTEQNWDAAHEVTLSNWDSQVSNETRKHGFIMTGNILQAFADAGSDGRVPGQLITYTDIDGNVHDGILMNQHWEPSQLRGSTVPLRNRMEQIENLPIKEHITSADGNVVITRYWSYYTVSVPKSKKTGAQYYEDARLLELVNDEDFYPHRGQLQADVPAANIRDVVERLSDLGVQVKSENQVKFDNETEMGQAQAEGRFNYSQKSLSHETKTNDSTKKDVPLTQRHSKSYTDAKGNYHRGIEEDLSELEDRISRAGKESFGISEQGSESPQGVQPSRPNPTEINELRKEAAQLRAEIASRSQKRQELRKQYNIDEKGNISLDDLSRMFHDLNRSKVLDKLFDKVVAVLKNLGVDFRFTDNLKGNVGGNALAFINVTFYNWDAQLRDLDNQEKARILLHEMIHNVTSHIIDRYKKPSLGKLTPKQERLVKEIINIYNKVKSTNPVRENGESPYGLENEYEMLSELANPEFRRTLDSIKYRGDMSILESIKQWFRKLFGLNTALDSLEKALDDILESYDENENKVYRQQRTDWENQMRDAGINLNYVDFWETGLGMLGRQTIVKDKSEIEKLENGPKEKGYRTVVQNADGTFGSPMAGRLSGKKGQQSKPTSSYRMGEWERSEENPQLATDNGKINLIKPGGLGTVGSVDYNPYIHIRENKLNKQFKNAWERPDLVYIEVDYPASEMTSGYRAEKAAKTVGRHKWPGGDLILSRWDKPVRIVPWNEVADDWEREFKNRGVEFDIVSPHLLPILVKRGVEILPPHKGMGEECKKAYEAFKAKQDANPMNAIQRAARQFYKNTEVEANPLEAIRKAAEGFARESNINNPQNPLSHSAKAVYDERLNRVETVFSEAYQDAMVSLKTAQNAIAGDKDIPDSQNAYMAENLSHGKNKNEQDLYNKMFRDPLISTINKIMNLTGMNWGDIDRYVYTKSGLERNREFYVRDWLEAERNRSIRKYEDLSSEEQDMYDDMANTIETMFEDGDIDEEEKNKKLAQALQKAHQRNIDSIEEGWIRTKTEGYQDLKDENILFPDYLESLDSFIRGNMAYDFDPSKSDYSGFRDMYGDENGEYDEKEVIDSMTETEYRIDDSEILSQLWDQINAATKYGLERYRESGMRSDEQIDKVEQMFHWYVPMRGFKEERGEDMYQYFTGKGRAKSYVGGLLKHAKGRGSEANFPISTIFAMSYKAIADCNQNLVCQKFYRLCQNNPNDLVILSDSWAVLNEHTGDWEEIAPEIPEEATEDEVREITLAWEDEMRELAKENKAKKIKGKATFDYKPMDRKKQSEHIVEVRINGQPRKMVVTGNPRMAQALNGQLRFEHGKNRFSKVNAAIKNMMASLFTSYSPTFAMRNMWRDWTHFRMMLGVREGRGYASRANKYYRQSLFNMKGLFKKYREGTLDERNEMERDFKDFMDNGGITGFVFMQKVEDIQKQMNKLYKQQKDGKAVRLNNKIWDNTLGLIEAVNEGIENNARFATYRASRHYAGRTKARSAYDAKEITVNFNRKGAGGKTSGFKSNNKTIETAAEAFGLTSQVLGEGRIFFNATVQAIATTFKNFQNPDGSLNKKYIAKWAGKYAFPPFAFGLLLPAINATLYNALGDDDDDNPYANLPEWTRRRNLCFYIGHDSFITVPIGQELAAFLTLGDIIAGYTYAPELKSVSRGIDDELLGFFNVFSPVDIDTKITKGGLMENPLSEVVGRTFSVLAPIIAVEQNLSWNGRPIYKEDKYENDEFEPEYKQVYQSTNPLLVSASKWLHEFSGGDDKARGKIEVNPAIVQYLWEQYSGGPGKVLSSAISMGRDVRDFFVEGEMPDFNIRKVEGLKAFIQQGDDRTQYYRTNEKYHHYERAANKYKHDHDITNLEKLAKKKDAAAMLELQKLEKDPDYIRFDIIREANRSSKKEGKVGLDELRKEIKKTTDRNEKRKMQREYNEAMRKVVEAYDDVREYE